jgi:DNA (cytosine-5)-methyltransferase 1
MNVLSLFAGIGGLELGLERAGMTVVGQVELDDYCRRVLAKHWPEVPRHDDVRTAVEWWQSEPRPPVHVACGGFPCQPFSLGGFQLGINDERWMWPAFANVIRAVRPRYVVVENVSALVRDRDAFGWVLGDLAALGFDAEWSVLRASDFGAPHPRERVYLLAYPASEHGEPRNRVGSGRDGAAPIPARGLSGLAMGPRRRAAREWLEREPGVARLANGIPGQVDRLRTLGNAVVPAAAEHIGRLIVEHELAVAA